MKIGGVMKNDNRNLIKSYDALFNATMNPIFKTFSMYMKRTGNIVTLDGVGLENTQQYDLML